MEPKRREGIDITFDSEGRAIEVYGSTVFFATDKDRNDFENWLKSEGGDQFTAYQEKLKRHYPKLCRKCRWLDQEHDQCYSGHLQHKHLEVCEDFDEHA
jgi:mevalonate kinase